MDKSDFVRLAPIYYAIAIREFFHTVKWIGGTASRAVLKEEFLVEGDDHDPYCYLENDVLLDSAIKWMISNEMLATIEDPFGPPIYLQTERAIERWEDIRSDENSAYARYNLAPDKKAWLRSALTRVNAEYTKLNLEQEDFENPDSEWEPIPVDRMNTDLKNAIRSIDETIEMVRSDNGYNASFPEEKSYVLDGLSSLSRTLKEAQPVSWPYIKTYGLEPLSRLIKRFGSAAIGACATIARDSIFTWLKSAGVKALDLLWKSLF